MQLQELRKETHKIKKDIKEKEQLLSDEQKKEITEDHIEILRFFLRNITKDLIPDLREILNLLIRRIKIIDLENIEIKF